MTFLFITCLFNTQQNFVQKSRSGSKKEKKKNKTAGTSKISKRKRLKKTRIYNFIQAEICIHTEAYSLNWNSDKCKYKHKQIGSEHSPRSSLMSEVRYVLFIEAVAQLTTTRRKLLQFDRH